MNLIGIINYNQFFSPFYFNDLLAKEIKKTVDNWDKLDEKIKKLNKLGDLYFKVKNSKNNYDLSLNFKKEFISLLGYMPYSDYYQLNDEYKIPILSKSNNRDSNISLLIIDVNDESSDTIESLLDVKFKLDKSMSYEKIIDEYLFSHENNCKYIILISKDELIFLDKAKWFSKRYLKLNFDELFERKNTETAKTIYGLLHHDFLMNSELLTELDENSHKKAFEVSVDLKHSIRESIELLANEYLHYQRENSIDYEIADPAILTKETLRYMYRLLFLFYVESRSELDYIPNDEVYNKGYSIECLRDLELKELVSQEDRNGYFFHASIKLLFNMIYEGRSITSYNNRGADFFELEPIKSDLFDPFNTKLLDSIKIRNFVWQEIIKNLSLTREKQDKKGRYRIYYGSLGINQLGAVYESLLSYKGFYAPETLYEVRSDSKKNKSSSSDDDLPVLESSYFITESELDNYTDNEKVYIDNKLKSYPKGAFIYRLAGRDRERSASYYTPEILTKNVVKYAIKELLGISNDGKISKSSKKIREVFVCEPAMGSAAFLNEAVNQLSEKYLEQKQKELGKKIDAKIYPIVLQQVKMYFADNNVFGVDLNDIAIELAEVSLWINALYGGGVERFIPYFRFQIYNGNSLIGARREVYDVNALSTSKSDDLWYNYQGTRDTKKLVNNKKKTNYKNIPHYLFGEEDPVTENITDQPDTSVYHFLLFYPEMANYDDKVIKNLQLNEFEYLKQWRQNIKTPYTQDEIQILLKFSSKLHELWVEFALHQEDMRIKTTDKLLIWGDEGYKEPREQEPDFLDNKRGKTSTTSLQEKNQVYHKERNSDDVANSTLYKRLKLVLDYWCSLWFWPIEDAMLIPTKAQFFKDLAILLECHDNRIDDNIKKDLLSYNIDEEVIDSHIKNYGILNIDKEISKNPRFAVVDKVSKTNKFFHWELEFADIFARKGGFDLILGNPPWLKPVWSESGILGEYNPLLSIRKTSATQFANLRDELLATNPQLKTNYIREYTNTKAMINYLGSQVNYQVLQGQVNLYKCFIPLSWYLLVKNGIAGLLHPEGVYDDSKGVELRQQMYYKLKYHFQFQNEKILFEIGHSNKYSINIYHHNSNQKIDFYTLANLFMPQTIDDCFVHEGYGEVIGIKNDDNEWNIKGHKDRLVRVTLTELQIFATLFSNNKISSTHINLPAIHCKSLLVTLDKVANFSYKFINSNSFLLSTTMFDETKSQKDGFIQRSTTFIKSTDQLILSGPHIFVNNPLFNTPEQQCIQKSDYATLDLTSIPDNYLPRTNYIFTGETHLNKIRTVNINNNSILITRFYRVIIRGMLSLSAERTLISSIIPPHCTHINVMSSFIFSNHKALLLFQGVCGSIIGDFYLKVIGASYLVQDRLLLFPYIDDIRIIHRVLGLNALTIYYKELYESLYNDYFSLDAWSKGEDSRLNQQFFKLLTPVWNRKVALRTDYERRQAMVELDVLVAIGLGLKLEQLLEVYRIYFPVMRQYDKETYYDQAGRIVFTISKSLTDIGVDRSTWEQIKNMQDGIYEKVIEDNNMPGGNIQRTITYHAPFDKFDREHDYKIAWDYFT